MKTFTININSKLENIEITVKNGRKFSEAAIQGNYEIFFVKVSDSDLAKIKKYAVKHADDKSSNKGNWYAHCNGYSMDLFVNSKGDVTINTYRAYGRDSK